MSEYVSFPNVQALKTEPEVLGYFQKLSALNDPNLLQVKEAGLTQCFHLHTITQPRSVWKQTNRT